MEKGINWVFTWRKIQDASHIVTFPLLDQSITREYWVSSTDNQLHLYTEKTRKYLFETNMPNILRFTSSEKIVVKWYVRMRDS